jgi:hypothetical protein
MGPSPQAQQQSTSRNIGIARHVVTSGYLHLRQYGHIQATGHCLEPRRSLGLEGLDRPALLPRFGLR